MLQAMIKPSKEASDLAKQYGVDMSVQAIQSKGLGGVLLDMKEKTNGNVEVMARMLGSTEALR